MLRDLDSRRKHEQQGKTFTEVPIAVKGESSSTTRWWVMGAGLLCLGAIIWLALWFFPLSSADIPEKMVTMQDKQQPDETQSAPQVPVEQEVETTPPPSTLDTSEVVQETAIQRVKLRGMVVNESAKRARLSINFNNLPEYRLEHAGNGDSQSKLVISLSGVQIDDNLEIPELTGKLLESISLRPQQKQLQLLVDLGEGSEVGSYELKGNSGSGFTLQIDINQVLPMIASTTKESPAQREMAAEPAKVVSPDAPEQIREKTSNSEQTNDNAHMSRSENRISLDKQGYQAGLEQMRQKNFAAAEKSFAAALKINQAHVQARLQLIESLQQQNKVEQAQAQMVEGLVQTPNSLQLRKTYARFLLDKQHNLEAIQVLPTQPFPAVSQDLEYHALLAALLQETRQFDAAAETYARLLQLRPETALWWFGFAVSMDQSGDFEQARNAYRRALALPGLSGNVQQYVQSRLQVL
jgi:tetratricopeptide (TPR) repeat protein